MHPEARYYIRKRVYNRQFDSVVEFGSRYINGGVRDLIAYESYWGIDIAPGEGVDEVADAATWRGEDIDLIVCCEVFEHTPEWELICHAAYDSLRPGGTFLVTCAAPPRAPHSAHDGGGLRDKEYYGNVEPEALHKALKAVGFSAVQVDFHPRGDSYAEARK